MFFSCTGMATVSFTHDAGPEPHYLRGAGGSQCRHYSSHESQVNRKKKKKKKKILWIPLWVAPALMTTVTKQPGGREGTGCKGHPSC